MANEKKKETPAAEPERVIDPSSGPRLKEPTEDVDMIMASFQMRSQGLDGAELEDEIERVLRLLIERHVKALPERAKEQARELVRMELQRDPTLSAMIQDLRDAARRGET